MLQMVFLDFFEALLGCAEVYVVKASEQPDTHMTATVTSVQQLPDATDMLTTEQIAPSASHSLSLVEQVLLISATCSLLHKYTVSQKCTFMKSAFSAMTEYVIRTLSKTVHKIAILTIQTL